MKRLSVLLLFASLVFCGTADAGQPFTLSGRIDGLEPGDTLRFERILLPEWDREFAFDVVVETPGTFRYEGTQPHDQYYMMTYHPMSGNDPVCDRSGKDFIVTAGDTVVMEGTVGEIYYCSLSGGIYDDPLLSESLRLDDSLGVIRGGYVKQITEAYERKDTVAGREYEARFNLFYQDNPGEERLREAKRIYSEANPQGTLYILVTRMSDVMYDPVEKSKGRLASYSEELRSGYYGRLMADKIDEMERLAEGRPAPDFTVVSTDGRRLAKADYAGRYLLIYHWGLCPGSIFLDGQVKELYGKYRGEGLEVLGVTESIAVIRKVYEGLPADQKTPMAGTEDIRPVLEGMLEHGWTEVEVETDCPENKALLESYKCSGWPFFVLIGPDGTIRARGFSEAFFAARGILDKELGGGSE